MAQPHLGAELRVIRQRLGFSLAEVAEAVAISPSFLGLVEKGRSDISIGRLMRLTQFYGVALADVLPHPDRTNPEIIRAGEHRNLPSATEGMEVLLLTNDGNRVMRPILATYEVGGSTSEHLRQQGDVFVYILSGEITIDVGEGDPFTLRAGDTAYLASGTPRRYRNTGSDRAVLIGVLAQDPSARALRRETAATRPRKPSRPEVQAQDDAPIPDRTVPTPRRKPAAA